MADDVDLRTLPPGPKGPNALTAMRFLLRGPHFLEACHARYGDAFTIRLNTGRTGPHKCRAICWIDVAGDVE